jgi:hypothetical protein
LSETGSGRGSRRRLSLDQFRNHRDALAWRVRAFKAVGEQSERLARNRVVWLPDRRERRCGQLRQGDVVETGDEDVLGDENPA